jgi:hypothetical protein
MRFSFKKLAFKLAFVALIGTLIPMFMLGRARGSDHADTPFIAANPGTDLTDVFVFPSPTNANNVVLVMDVHPLIPSGQGTSTYFDPTVLYQFKIDTTQSSTKTFVENRVIQFKFTGTGTSQQVQVAGLVTPARTGTVTQFMTPDSVVGTYNKAFTLSSGIQVFCGPREDPFFFDLNQFFTIFPDRANPLGATITNTAGQTVSTTPANPDAPEATSFRPVGQAQDFLKGFNVLSIVVELPKSLFTDPNTGKVGKIAVWATTSR